MLTPNEAHDLCNLLQRVMYYTEMAELNEAKQTIRRVNDYINVHTAPRLIMINIKGDRDVNT